MQLQFGALAPHKVVSKPHAESCGIITACGDISGNTYTVAADQQTPDTFQASFGFTHGKVAVVKKEASEPGGHPTFSFHPFQGDDSPKGLSFVTDLPLCARKKLADDTHALQADLKRTMACAPDMKPAEFLEIP